MSLISNLLYPVPRPTYSKHDFPEELIWLPRLAGHAGERLGTLPALLLRCPNARFLVLHFHSNGEDIGACHPFGCGLRTALEVHVLLVEYPGYGLCPGEASEEGLWSAARSALHFATQQLRWPAEDIILMGRSLGAAVATRLAATAECWMHAGPGGRDAWRTPGAGLHGLVLLAPFLSLAEALGQFLPGGGSGSLARLLATAAGGHGEAFSSRSLMPLVRAAVLVVHGAQDRLVDCAHGRRLVELCSHERRVFVCPPGLAHNGDVLGDPDILLRPMLQFFSLPDYRFEELKVPADVLRLPSRPVNQVVERARQHGNGPLFRVAGDVDACPAGRGAPRFCASRCPAPAAGSDGEDEFEGGLPHAAQVYPHVRGPANPGGVFPDVMMAFRAEDWATPERHAAGDAASPPGWRPCELPLPLPRGSRGGLGGLSREATEELLQGLRGLDLDVGVRRFMSEEDAVEAI